MTRQKGCGNPLTSLGRILNEPHPGLFKSDAPIPVKGAQRLFEGFFARIEDRADFLRAAVIIVGEIDFNRRCYVAGYPGTDASGSSVKNVDEGGIERKAKLFQLIE